MCQPQFGTKTLPRHSDRRGGEQDDVTLTTAQRRDIQKKKGVQIAYNTASRPLEGRVEAGTICGHEGCEEGGRWRPNLPKVLRFSMDINSAFCRKRPLKAVLVKRARGEIQYLLKMSDRERGWGIRRWSGV